MGFRTLHPRSPLAAFLAIPTCSILANLSQELCRPLISLRMGFDLLLANTDPPLSGDLRGHVDTMVGLCEELLSLTRGYLDYASLVQGTRPFSLGTYTVSALIREIDRQFALVASARKIAWECRLEGADATVVTDASRFQQILGNLVGNALNFTPEGGSTQVSARLDDDHWIIVVADTGAGIPGDQIERVFEPFYRFGRNGRAARRRQRFGLGELPGNGRPTRRGSPP